LPANPVPDGYHTVTPYLTCTPVDQVVDFLLKTFDATEVEHMSTPDGRVMHAEVRIGDSIVMLGEPSGQWTPMPAALYVYVADCDAAYQRALSSGAISVAEPADQFYGDRHCGVRDPAGNLWWIATHQEDVAPSELKRRHAEAARSGKEG
jgi:PhnB protein